VALRDGRGDFPQQHRRQSAAQHHGAGDRRLREARRLMGFRCRECREEHDELPMSFHAEMPQAWMEIPEEEEDERGQLSSDQCEIDGHRFFMRGLLRVPIHGMDQSLDWGVWFELSQESYQRFCDLWEQDGREREPLHPATLATRLPTFLYPDTLGMPVQIR